MHYCLGNRDTQRQKNKHERYDQGDTGQTSRIDLELIWNCLCLESTAMEHGLPGVVCLEGTQGLRLL